MKKITEPIKGPLTGKRYNFWKVGLLLPYPENRKNNKQRYICKCKCGTEKPVETTNLIRGASKSCGCRPFTVTRYPRFKPRVIGNFTVKSIAEYKYHGIKVRIPIALYNVECSCGRKSLKYMHNLQYQTGCCKDCPHTKRRIKEMFSSLGTQS